PNKTEYEYDASDGSKKLSLVLYEKMTFDTKQKISNAHSKILCFRRWVVYLWRRMCYNQK
ncbi:MAG: hypothetical protein II711_03875, partial [Clostridia bacterium]|nr:hypothetical protein [Clostridia bacterium]